MVISSVPPPKSKIEHRFGAGEGVFVIQRRRDRLEFEIHLLETGLQRGLAQRILGAARSCVGSVGEIHRAAQGDAGDLARPAGSSARLFELAQVDR